MKIVLIVIMIATVLMGKPLPVNKKAYNRVMNAKVSYSIYNRTLKDLIHLNASQLANMRLLYQECKPFGLEQTCVAISYKESRLGKYMFNELTGDYGLLGINLKQFIRSKKLKLSYWGKKELASKLITDNRLNIRASISNLKEWQRHYGNNWKMVYASYNGGWCPSKPYAVSIISYMRAFRVFLNKHEYIRNFMEKSYDNKILANHEY